MTLLLKVAEVAQPNINQFDRLGAFAGERTCMYHYPGGMDYACSIGIMDTTNLLEPYNSGYDVVALIDKDIITTDDRRLLIFIQKVHDYKAVGRDPLSQWLLYHCLTALPSEIVGIVETIRGPSDLTPDLYKFMMSSLVSLYGDDSAPEEEKTVEHTLLQDMEPEVLKHLADAIESLQRAHRATAHGFVADHCENALTEIKHAIRNTMGN